MAEQEGNHRRQLETTNQEQVSKALNHKANGILRGQIFGFVISLVFLAIAAYAIYRGYPWAGTVLSGLGVGGIVSTFVIGPSSRQKNGA